jgi:hypothetical protein
MSPLPSNQIQTPQVALQQPKTVNQVEILLSKVDFTSILNYIRLTENKVHDL